MENFYLQSSLEDGKFFSSLVYYLMCNTMRNFSCIKVGKRGGGWEEDAIGKEGRRMVGKFLQK
jgi:hypothetical protein